MRGEGHGSGQALVRERRVHIASLLAFQRDDLREKSADSNLPDQLRLKADRLQAEAQNNPRLLIGKSGLQLSPEAFAVISADDHWKEHFDLSKAIGRLGDLNVAIKMEERGNFTIKGVSFDPSEVARAISKMGTQLVMAVAQANGVPVRKGAATSTAAGFATSSEALGVTTASVETANAERSDRREALLTIATAITREKSAIEGSSEDKRKAAMKAIKDTFTAHKTRVSP